jgi:hypothetical protein
LYSRYASKEELLRKLCHDGLALFVSETEGALFERVKPVLRPDLELHDLSLLFEVLAAVKVADRGRTMQLRRRYLALVLDGLRSVVGESLPEPGPSWSEINERWVT